MHLALAFDRPEPTFRHKVFKEYKATREKMPDDLVAQLPRLREVLEATGIPIVEEPGWEADDLIGTLAKAARAEGFEVYMVTGDKDCRQLINDRVRMYNIRKDEVFDAEALFGAWGIRPDQVVDFQALTGV